MLAGAQREEGVLHVPQLVLTRLVNEHQAGWHLSYDTIMHLLLLRTLLSLYQEPQEHATPVRRGTELPSAQPPSPPMTSFRGRKADVSPGAGYIGSILKLRVQHPDSSKSRSW